MIPLTKWCSGCKRTLTVIVNVTFNLKTAAHDGLQPWCRECDMANKPRAENGWANFRKKLRDRKRGEERYWTEAIYLEMMEAKGWKCKYCGCDVSVWGSGYWVDKIDPTRPYKPDNCVAACWPCNCLKREGKGGVFSGFVAAKVQEWGWGKVPWQILYPRFRRVDDAIPDLSEYVQPDTTQQASLFDRDPGLEPWR